MKQQVNFNMLIIPNEPLSCYKAEKLTWANPPFRYFNPNKVFNHIYIYDRNSENKLIEKKDYSILRVKNKWIFGRVFNDVSYIVKKLKNKKISVIRAYNPNIEGLMAYKLSKKLGIPFVISLHNDYELARKIERHNFLKRFFLSSLERWLIKKADGIFCVSSYLYSYVLKIRQKPDGVYLIYNKVDIKYFQKKNLSEIKKIKNRFNQKKIFVFIGRLVPQKDVQTIIKALRIYKDNEKNDNFILLVIGSGKLKNKLETLVNDMNLKKNIIFMGNIENTKIKNYLHAADAFICPSLYEGFGIVFAEAQAAGTPIIATNIPMTKDIINKSNALLHDIKDSDGLAKCIKSIFKDRSKIKLLVNAGLKNVTKFDWNILEKYEADYYINIIKKFGC